MSEVARRATRLSGGEPSDAIGQEDSMSNMPVVELRDQLPDPQALIAQLPPPKVPGKCSDDLYEELNRRSQECWPWMLRFLDVTGETSLGRYFDGLTSVQGRAEQECVLIDTSTLAWEMTSTLEGGYGFVSLTAHLKGIPPDLAAVMLEQALRDVSDNEDPRGALVPVSLPPPCEDQAILLSLPAWFGEPERLHEYRTASGQVACVVARYSMSLGPRPPGGAQLLKPMSPCRSSGGELQWRKGWPSGELPLYGMDLLAANPGVPVVLVHGEEGADYIRGMSFGPKGRKWPPAGAIVVGVSGCDVDGTATDLSLLTGRDVYIFARSGEKGRLFAENVQRRLEEEDPGVGISKVEIVFEQGGVALLEEESPISTDGWSWRDFKAFSDEGLDKLGLRIPGVRRKFDPVVQDQVIDDFQVNRGGVWVRKFKDGEPEDHWLSTPIHVLNLARNSDSQAWGVTVTCQDPDERWHSWCIPSSMLAGDTAGVYKMLSSLGATITPYPGLRTELARYLQTTKPAGRALSVNKPGWHRHQFVLPDGFVVNRGNSDESIVLQTPDPLGGNFVKYRGTLRQWRATVGKLCQGNSRLVLAIAAALAGPVLFWLSEENGGFHFKGNSSIGKTTILHVASGIWGPPRQFMRLWRATANGLESVAASYNDLVLILDEMSQVNALEVGPVAYMLANGQGKQRSTQTGDAKPNASWRLIFLSSGEVGLKEHIESGGGRVMAGQETRMIDIEADAGQGLGIFDTLNGVSSGAELSLALKSEADQYHGVVGRAWLAVLADPVKRDSVLASIRADIEIFKTSVPVGAAGQVSRVARRFGLIAAVGEAAVRAGVLPWPEGHVMEQVKVCFRDWLARRGSTANLEGAQAVEGARRYFQLHGESRFTWTGVEGIESTTEVEGRIRTVNRAGFRRLARDQSVEFLVFPEVFESEICGGLSRKVVIAELLRLGYLKPAANGRPYQTVRVSGIGIAKFYCISSSILGGEVEADSAAAA